MDVVRTSAMKLLANKQFNWLKIWTFLTKIRSTIK